MAMAMAMAMVRLDPVYDEEAVIRPPSPPALVPVLVPAQVLVLVFCPTPARVPVLVLVPVLSESPPFFVSLAMISAWCPQWVTPWTLGTKF
jgi:hypothetical protein